MTLCFSYHNIKYCLQSGKSTLTVGDNSDNNHNAIVDISTIADEITIPKYVKWQKVTEIGSNAFRCSSLRKVYINAQVVTINLRAFDQCQYLEYINIPSSVESIEGNAFCLSVQTEGTMSSGSTTVVFEANSHLKKLEVGNFVQKSQFILSYCGPLSFSNCGNSVFQASHSITLYVPPDVQFCPSVKNSSVSIQSMPKEVLCPPIKPHKTLPCTACFRKKFHYKLCLICIYFVFSH